MACGSGVGPELKNLERLAAARSGVTATSFGGSEPFGALIFLFQLAGQTCVPCQPVGGAPLRGGGRASRALLTNHRCLGGAEARDVRAGWRRQSGSAPSPACARTCLPPTPPGGGFQVGRPGGTCSVFHAGGIPAAGKPCVHRRASAKLEGTFQKCFW